MLCFPAFQYLRQLRSEDHRVLLFGADVAAEALQVARIHFDRCGAVVELEDHAAE